MYQSSISMIQKRVGDDLRQGCAVDVYRLASAVEADCFDLTHEDVVKAIEWAVGKASGEAIWDKRAA